MDLIVLGVIFVLVLLAIYHPVLPEAVCAYLRYREREALRCPETDQLTSVQINAWRAALTLLLSGKAKLQVRNCARWPGSAGCPQGCTAQFV